MPISFGLVDKSHLFSRHSQSEHAGNSRPNATLASLGFEVIHPYNPALNTIHATHGHDPHRQRHGKPRNSCVEPGVKDAPAEESSEGGDRHRHDRSEDVEMAYSDGAENGEAIRPEEREFVS